MNVVLNYETCIILVHRTSIYLPCYCLLCLLIQRALAYRLVITIKLSIAPRKFSRLLIGIQRISITRGRLYVKSFNLVPGNWLQSHKASSDLKMYEMALEKSFFNLFLDHLMYLLSIEFIKIILLEFSLHNSAG